MVLADRRPT